MWESTCLHVTEAAKELEQESIVCEVREDVLTGSRE